MSKSVLGALFVSLVLSSCASGTHHIKRGESDVIGVTLNYNNVYMFKYGDKAILIDSGLEKDGQDLVDELKEEGVSSSDVNAILITHAHPDHAGGLAALKKVYDVPVIGGAGDQHMFEAGKLVHKEDALCPTNRMAKRRLEKDGGAEYQGFTPDVLLESERDLNELVGIPGKVLLRQSHTPGSLIVVSGEVAFVGDLFRGSIVGKNAETHFYICDLEQNKKDIESLMAITPPIQVFFTGHFGPVEREEVQEYLDEL